MGRSHIVALIVGILGGIYWIGNGMNWANNAHDFYTNYLSSITGNQLQQQVIAWAYWFFFQQQIGITATFSVPVIAFAVVLIGVSAYLTSKR